jgi:hypothetical protein
LSKLFNNDITNIIKLVFDSDDLISQRSGWVIFYMIYFDDCFDVLIKNQTIEKIISINENEERKERMDDSIEFEIGKNNSCDISKDVFKNKIYKLKMSGVDHSVHCLLISLERLIRSTDISLFFKIINREQIKSLSKVVGIYFNFLNPFLDFPFVISLILNCLITKNVRDDEEEEFILKIEKQLLFNWEEVVNSLTGKRFMTYIGIKHILVDFSLTFLLCGGLWVVTDVFYKFKRFYNFQYFSFTKYESAL